MAAVTRVRLAPVTESEFDAVCALTRQAEFNQTARALEPPQLRELTGDRFVRALTVWLSEPSGDTVAGAVLTRRRAGAEHVDVFVASGVAVEAGVTEAVLAAVLRHAREDGATVVYAAHHPAERNARFADFYAERGFVIVTGVGTVKTYRHSLEDLPGVPAHIELQTTEGVAA